MQSASCHGCGLLPIGALQAAGGIYTYCKAFFFKYGILLGFQQRNNGPILSIFANFLVRFGSIASAWVISRPECGTR